jgi:hypothetical protein
MGSGEVKRSLAIAFVSFCFKEEGAGCCGGACALDLSCGDVAFFSIRKKKSGIKLI